MRSRSSSRRRIARVFSSNCLSKPCPSNSAFMSATLAFFSWTSADTRRRSVANVPASSSAASSAVMDFRRFASREYQRKAFLKELHTPLLLFASLAGRSDQPIGHSKSGFDADIPKCVWSFRPEGGQTNYDNLLTRPTWRCSTLSCCFCCSSASTLMNWSTWRCSKGITSKPLVPC